jgi:ESF2/ABP1 family protein
MVKPSDEEISPPSSSKLIPEQIINDSESLSNADANSMSELEESIDGPDDGMDAAGFAGPKVVKPLTQEALAVFRAAQEKAGMIYISRIPPGMQPAKVRHLMSQYGEVGRVYLQKEGTMVYSFDYS